MFNNFHGYNRKLHNLCFILFILWNLYLSGDQNIRDILNTVPISEKKDLEKLFQDLFNRDNFSYTLFGDKPMSLTNYSTTLFDSDDIPSISGLRFQKRWNIWKKHEHHFNIHRYLLIEGPNRDEAIKDIYFINKSCFVGKVNENIGLFREAFGNEITGALLIEKIEKNPTFLSILNHHPILLGILFGYGEHNARLFGKRDKLSPFVYRKEFPKVPSKIPEPAEGFSSLREEFNSYFSVLTLFGDTKYSPLVIGSVHFVADHNHPETVALQEKYRKMRGDISAIYSKGDFLEITLSKLTEK